MAREEREELGNVIAEAAALGDRAGAILRDREETRRVVRAAAADMRSRAIDVHRDGQLAWKVVPVLARDETLPSSLAALRDLVPLPEGAAEVLEWLRDGVGAAAHAALPISRRLLFAGRKKFDPARDAAAALPGLLVQASSLAAVRLLELLEGAAAPRVVIPFDDVGDPSLGFCEHFGTPPGDLVLLTGASLAGLTAAIGVLDKAVSDERRHVDAARAAGEKVRQDDVRRLLVAMPLDALRQTADGTMQLRPLISAGVNNVQEVLDHAGSLGRIPGVGPTTVRRVVGAAMTLRQVTYEDTSVRIDIEARRPETTRLLTALRIWDGSRVTRGAATDLERAGDLRGLSDALRRGPDRWLVIAVASTPSSMLLDSVGAVVRRAALIGETAAPGVGAGDVWDDFLSRAADYFGLLAELGFITEDVKKAHGDLPDEVVEAVRAQELRTENIRVSLRGYQSFAARFALVQGKVLIGDEMGLGKTVEALAVLAHLRSTGESHFLVVCPAAVVSNWMRETTRHTTLRPYRIHGDQATRLLTLKSWVRAGGVGVTTFDLLDRVVQHFQGVQPGCVVVDEAHYIKNPDAQRSRRAQAVITATPRAILMSGTPLENRVEEFRNLIGYIRPDLANAASEISPSRFRKHVAPAYLRRNQEDVLTELPELVEVDEWLEMSAADRAHYRDAVLDGNFAAMRRAAMVDRRSEKLHRLREIVVEAEDNGRRVIVYSYFLDVLALIAEDLRASQLPGQVFGPLTGSVPAARRQDMVDAFSAYSAGAVLVSQIVAGGVGLNIQSASVVVICEPQLKPTTESQAIARAHRMGQVQSVQVHRLLSEDGVDERIREILARKKQLFDEFARISETADSAPEAVDISEVEFAREVVTTERLRLFGGDSAAALAAAEPTRDAG